MGGHGEPSAGPGSGGQSATERRGAFAHASDAAAGPWQTALVDHRSPAVVADLDVEPVGLVREPHGGCGGRAAWRATLVSDSCTIR